MFAQIVRFVFHTGFMRLVTVRYNTFSEVKELPRTSVYKDILDYTVTSCLKFICVMQKGNKTIIDTLSFKVNNQCMRYVDY
jgi:hypothetical protein